MRIFTSADNRRAYRVKAIVNDSVLYDVAFNDEATPTETDTKFGNNCSLLLNLTMPLAKFAVHLANLGAYFKPGHDAIVAAGFKVQ